MCNSYGRDECEALFRSQHLIADEYTKKKKKTTTTKTYIFLHAIDDPDLEKNYHIAAIINIR